jgi:hypothetical protein
MLGDFNLIYRATNKSNGNVNRRLMNRFCRLLDELEVKEIHFHGRKFTWSSGTANPTQIKIYHVFVTREWELMYTDCHLQAGGSSMSDHCPMILNCSPFHMRYKGFRFESCGLVMTEFKELVAQSWMAPVHSMNKARVLHIKLARLAKSLKQWNKQRILIARQEERDTQELVLHLDQLQEQRQLTEAELQTHKTAKNKILGYASVRKIRLRQRSRLTWIRLGDANTKIFHLRANAR